MHYLLRLVSLALLTCAQASAQTVVFPDLWTPSGTVEGMAVVGDTLYVSGGVNYVGPPTGQLAVLDKQTGEPDLTLPRVDATGNPSEGIKAILPDGEGGYYVGGQFRYVGGEEVINLARVLPDGTLDAAFQPNPAAAGWSGYVSTLFLAEGVLYVGGRFDGIGQSPRMDLAAIDTATGQVLPLSLAFARLNASHGVRSLAWLDGVLYIAGQFAAVNGTPRTGVAAVTASGDVLSWSPALTPPSPFPAPFVEHLVLGDSTLYLGGRFSSVGGQPRSNVAEVTPHGESGGVPTAWQPSEAFVGLAYAVVGEDLWVARPNVPALLRVSRHTGAVAEVPVGPGLRGGTALAFDPDGGPSGHGTLYLAAMRAFAPGGARRFPVVLGVDPATGAPTGYEVLGGGEDRPVHVLAVEPGAAGRVFAGGAFRSLGGERRRGLAALDLTTGRATAFGAETGAPFQDLAADPAGRYLYGYVQAAGASRLTEYDLETGATREFLGGGASPGGITLEGSSTGVASPGTARSGAAASDAGSGGGRYVANSTSALVVTDDRVCVSLGAAICLDRATADVVWDTPAARYASNMNGDLLIVAPEDLPGGPVSSAGVLFVSAPIAEVPVGTPRAGFLALDFGTGALLDWDVGVDWQSGARGYAVSWLRRDGAPEVYFGGQSVSAVQGHPRRNLFGVEAADATVTAWDPDVFQGVVLALRAMESAGGDLVYAGGSFTRIGGEDRLGVAALDAENGSTLPWMPETWTTTVLLPSVRHEAVFVGGDFDNSMRGSGHGGVVAVTPARPFTVSTEPETESPRSVRLSAPFPNPARGAVSFTLGLPEAGSVAVAVFDVLGRRVAVVVEGVLEAGEHALSVDVSGLPSGVYVVRASGEAFTESRRVTVVR